MNKKYFIGAGILVILIILGFTMWKGTKAPNKSTLSPKRTLPKEVTVTLDNNGFSPKIVTINVGSAVRWKNVSGKSETVNSDKYPTNQLHRELNFGVFNNGSSVVYTFTKAGTYGYHNQFNHTQVGKVIVTQ